MTGFDSGTTLADRMRSHAGDRDHLYGHLMRAMADDWDAGGPVRTVCRRHEDAPPGSVLQLRLLAGLFRIVLTARAPQLEPYYPCLGGTAPPSQAWREVRPVIAAHVDELRAALEIAPQTNETGRSTALLVGLFDAVRRAGLSRVRLLEPGASAGLNLLVDRFRFVNPTWSAGPADSAVQLVDGVVGAVTPTAFEVVERRGCDLSPVDPTTAEGRLLLRSFVWPFHVDRHQRLARALEVAAAYGATPVDRAGAGEWLERRLAESVDDDVLTVVWQSITRMYWPASEVTRVDAAIAAGAERQALAHIAMEHGASGLIAELTSNLSTGAGLTGVRRIATVGDHGPPVTLG